MESFLVLAHYRRLDFGFARELAGRVIAMAEQTTAPVMLAGAHFVLGLVDFASGHFPPAHEHLERALDLSGAGPTRNFAAYFTQGAANVDLAVLLILGYLSTARTKSHELLAAARANADPYWLATALFLDSLNYIVLRDNRMVAQRADEILFIATGFDMPLNLIAAGFFRGWGMAAAGRGEEGIAEMRRSISDPRLAYAMGRAIMRVQLAETYLKYVRTAEGLDLVAEGLATADRTGQSAFESELYRLKGELLMIKDRSNVVEAERCLRTAIDIARRQGARLFELRSTVSLARLLRDTKRHDEARRMLSEIYGWFTEGFDTVDLKEAKALLEELT
jgi:tetratricopeptide (TPR) repeat protein